MSVNIYKILKENRMILFVDGNWHEVSSGKKLNIDDINQLYSKFIKSSKYLNSLDTHKQTTNKPPQYTKDQLSEIYHLMSLPTNEGKGIKDIVKQYGIEYINNAVSISKDRHAKNVFNTCKSQSRIFRGHKRIKHNPMCQNRIRPIKLLKNKDQSSPNYGKFEQYKYNKE